MHEAHHQHPSRKLKDRDNHEVLSGMGDVKRSVVAIHSHVIFHVAYADLLIRGAGLLQVQRIPSRFPEGIGDPRGHERQVTVEKRVVRTIPGDGNRRRHHGKPVQRVHHRRSDKARRIRQRHHTDVNKQLVRQYGHFSAFRSAQGRHHNNNAEDARRRPMLTRPGEDEELNR